ncbi:MAG TPA: hypothetical protein VGH82_10235 [Gaiellaceae bacterium]|jgi:sensor c-di-GMP phosphodiesterase-like protein
MKLLVLAALFAGGALAAGVVATIGNAQTAETTTTTVTETTTARETTTVQETTTAPETTVVTTTVAPTTTSAPATTAATTSTAANSASTTPTWVWVLLALLAAAVIGLAVALFTRRGPPELPEPERRRLLQSAVESWTAQGWALVNETRDTAVLQRDGERMTVSIDPAGQVSARLITTQPPQH